MKLYAWRPGGYGEYSFFVVAESEQKAREAVTEHIKNNRLHPAEYGGWGTEYYEMQIAEIGEVLYNVNE